MAGKQKKSRAYPIFIAVMLILLILAVALFIYGSANNGVVQPRLPGKGVFGVGTMLHHG